MKRNHILAIILCLSVATGLWYLYVKRNNNSPALEKASTSKESNSTVKQADNSRDEKLTAIIKDWADNNVGEFGVMVREVSGQQRYSGYQENKQIIAASTYKLFLTYAIFDHIENNKLNFNSKLSDGSTISQCLEPLIVQSSDACAFGLGDLIGWPEIDSFIKQKGFNNTSINNYTSEGDFTSNDKLTTASDEAELVWRLANGTYANKENSDLLLGYMKRQIWRERIAAGLPQNIEVASKPGFIYNIQNDSGIVYGNKSTYVISILSDGSSPGVLADLSKRVYQYLNQ